MGEESHIVFMYRAKKKKTKRGKIFQSILEFLVMGVF
jgi:hypothetical protein